MNRQRRYLSLMISAALLVPLGCTKSQDSGSSEPTVNRSESSVAEGRDSIKWTLLTVERDPRSTTADAPVSMVGRVARDSGSLSTVFGELGIAEVFPRSGVKPTGFPQDAVVVVQLTHDGCGPYGIADVALVSDTQLVVTLGRYREARSECAASATPQLIAFRTSDLSPGANPSVDVAVPSREREL